MYFSTFQQARAYAAKLLRTETIAQYGMVYHNNSKIRNRIPYSAKIIEIISSKGHYSTTTVSFKNRLYVAKARKDTKGEYRWVFYPMSANGEVSSRSVNI